MYLLALLLACAYIILPLIAIKRNSVSLSEFLVFSGFIGNKLYSKRRGISRKVISKNDYLKASFIRQSLLGIFMICLLLILYLSKVSVIPATIILLIYLFTGGIFIGSNLNKYLVLK